MFKTENLMKEMIENPQNKQLQMLFKEKLSSQLQIKYF